MKSLFYFLAYFLILIPVQAAEWTTKASVVQNISYDDNVRMEENTQGSMIYHITPNLNFARKTENTTLHANVSYGIQRYLNLKEFNQDSQRYSLGGNYLAERSQGKFNLFLNTSPARNSAEEDSGDFSSNATKITYSIVPSFSYQLTEMDSLSFSPSYSKTTYSSGNFSDNTNAQLSIAWNRRWTERYVNSFSVFYSVFESSGLEKSTNTSYGGNLSGTYEWSERLKLSSSLGLRWTQSKGERTNTSNKMGFLANIGAQYRGEIYGVGLNWNRSLTPSAQGDLNNQDRVSLNLNYKFTEHLTTDLLATYQNSQSATSTSSSQNSTRENILFRPSMNWKITPDWRMSMSYRYQLQSRDNRETVTDSNLFMLSVNYNWQGLSLSR